MWVGHEHAPLVRDQKVEFTHLDPYDTDIFYTIGYLLFGTYARSSAVALGRHWSRLAKTYVLEAVSLDCPDVLFATSFSPVSR